MRFDSPPPTPDGLEIAGGQQVGISQLAGQTNGNVTLTVVGFEYDGGRPSSFYAEGDGFLHFSERGTSCPKHANSRVSLLLMMRMSSRRPWQ